MKEVRIVSGLVAACCFCITLGLYWGKSTDYFLPSVWPFWFFGTTIAVLAYSFHPLSKKLLELSGVMVIIGMLSRIVAIVVNVVHGGVYSNDARAFWVGLGLWGLAAVTCQRVWRGFARVTGREVAGRGS